MSLLGLGAALTGGWRSRGAPGGHRGATWGHRGATGGHRGATGGHRGATGGLAVLVGLLLLLLGQVSNGEFSKYTNVFSGRPGCLGGLGQTPH